MQNSTPPRPDTIGAPEAQHSPTPALLTRRELRERERAAALLADDGAAALPSPSLLATTVAPSVTVAPTVAVAVLQPSPTYAAAPLTAPTFPAFAPHTAPSRSGAPRSTSTLPAPTSPPARARRLGHGRRVASKVATFGAMIGVGLILIATTVPATAFARPDPRAASASGVDYQSTLDTQDLGVDAAASPAIIRDEYTIVSKSQSRSSSGGSSGSYTNDPSGTIQWPFDTGVRISSGFGARHVANCSFCSTVHQGLDFNPGAGAPIHAVADGVVSLVENSGSGLGSHIVIDHVINGRPVQSVYGHLRYGSIAVAEGQRLAVGQVIGVVGSTGASTGPHLHLEIHLAGTPVDPYAWLRANAN